VREENQSARSVNARLRFADALEKKPVADLYACAVRHGAEPDDLIECADCHRNHYAGLTCAEYAYIRDQGKDLQRELYSRPKELGDVYGICEARGCAHHSSCPRHISPDSHKFCNTRCGGPKCKHIVGCKQEHGDYRARNGKARESGPIIELVRAARRKRGAPALHSLKDRNLLKAEILSPAAEAINPAFVAEA